MSLNAELNVFYSYFDQLVVSEEYYRLELLPARRWALTAKGVSAACAAVATGTVFEFVNDWLATLAPLAAAAPYIAAWLGYTDERIARLDELWKGYKTQREAMQLILDELQMRQRELRDQRSIPTDMVQRKSEIERIITELSSKDEPEDRKTAAKATASARKLYPPIERWYLR